MKKACLKQILEVRDTIADHQQAYAYRSRLGRVILSCLNIVTKSLNLPSLSLPGIYEIPEKASQNQVNIINSCNKLWELSRVLSQPSEPLEKRWVDGWEELHIELENLNILIYES
jgi:hypothetical protein